MIILIIVGLIKKTLYNMGQYLPTPSSHKENIKVEIDVVKNDVVKKTVYDKLVAKVNNIDTNNFVLKANFNTKFTGLENKIPNTSGLVKRTGCNTKITEIEGKIPDIHGLTTKSALTTVENKIPSIVIQQQKLH